uniref:Cyclin-dependent kinase inhibitor domain-containing protein n=1 Tax=Panagrolaimus sp. JU765 TaxID=591449 RepID=A0AC34R4H3_9BILA
MSESLPKVVKRGRKLLFGILPEDAQNANKLYCQQELKKILDKKTEQWDFDFRHGVPMPSSSNFQYEAVPNDSVPKFYRSTSVKQQISDVPTTSSSNLEDVDVDSVMDENIEVKEMKDVLRIQKKVERTPKKMRQSQSKMQGFLHVQKQKTIVKKSVAGSSRSSIRHLDKQSLKPDVKVQHGSQCPSQTSRPPS